MELAEELPTRRIGFRQLDLNQIVIGARPAVLDAREQVRKLTLKALRALSKIDKDNTAGSYPFYYEYYAAQAFFQGDFKNWGSWNKKRVQQLIETQGDDGSWDGGLGPAISTSFALLSIALNYRYLPIYER